MAAGGVATGAGVGAGGVTAGAVATVAGAVAAGATTAGLLSTGLVAAGPGKVGGALVTVAGCRYRRSYCGQCGYRSGPLVFGAAGCEQFTDQGQLGRDRLVGCVQLQCLVIGLTCQFGVNITQVFVGGSVAGVGADGHLQRGAGLVELALACVQNRQVVVGLGQLGVVFGQPGEGCDGFLGFACVALNHSLEKTHLGITWLCHQMLVRLGHCFCQFARAHQLVHIRVFIGMGYRKYQAGSDGQCAQGEQCR